MNVHEMLIEGLGRLLNVLRTLNLRYVSRG